MDFSICIRLLVRLAVRRRYIEWPPLLNFPVSYVRSWLIFVKPNSRGANKSSVAAALFLLSPLRFPIPPPLSSLFPEATNRILLFENHRQIFRLVSKRERNRREEKNREDFFERKGKERKERTSDSGNTVLFIERSTVHERNA